MNSIVVYGCCKELKNLKRSFLTYNNKTVHLTEWGKEHQPTIICLHGLGSTSLSFLEIADVLKNDFRLIAFDAPGHGKSDEFNTAEEYEMPILVEWLHALLQLSLHYLTKYPNHVIDTILIDGGYQTKRVWSPSLEEEMDHYEKDFDEYVFDSWNSFYQAEKGNYLKWSPLKEVAVRDLGVERGGKVCWHARGETARHIIRGMHVHETADIYHLLPKEITLLVATLPERLSDIRLQTAEAFKQNAHGRVKVIPRTTHLLHWDRPEIVVEEIQSKWLTKMGG